MPPFPFAQREGRGRLKESTKPAGKTRTRQHVIADLAVNHLERHILRGGHTAERVRYDYGYDLIVNTFNEQGEAEPGAIYFQIKATDSLPLLKDGKTITWPVSRRDLKLWLNESDLVMLVVYDARRERAFWVYVREYFASGPTSGLFRAGEMVQLHIPIRNMVNSRSVRRWVRWKNELLKQVRRQCRHD